MQKRKPVAYNRQTLDTPNPLARFAHRKPELFRHSRTTSRVVREEIASFAVVRIPFFQHSRTACTVTLFPHRPISRLATRHPVRSSGNSSGRLSTVKIRPGSCG